MSADCASSWFKLMDIKLVQKYVQKNERKKSIKHT